MDRQNQSPIVIIGRMNCAFCKDRLWLCEACDAPWPCSDHDAGYPCTACNSEAVLPAGYESIAHTPEREQH